MAEFPALRGLLRTERGMAEVELLRAARLHETDGFDMRSEIIDYLKLLDRCDAELAAAGDCGADAGECLCLCHPRTAP